MNIALLTLAQTEATTTYESSAGAFCLNLLPWLFPLAIVTLAVVLAIRVARLWKKNFLHQEFQKQHYARTEALLERIAKAVEKNDKPA